MNFMLTLYLLQSRSHCSSLYAMNDEIIVSEKDTKKMCSF